MAIQVGDIVHIVCWDTDHGDYVEEYRLVEIASDHLKLEHLATYRNKAKLAGSHSVESRSLQYLNYFSIPLEERLREHRESIDWLTAEFLKP